MATPHGATTSNLCQCAVDFRSGNCRLTTILLWKTCCGLLILGVWTQQRENKDRPRRKNQSSSLDHWYGQLPRIPMMARAQPRLGQEHSGMYFAPDGQWFAGVSKVITVGLVSGYPDYNVFYIFVEPIPGKSGGDYDFFHPVTREWMDALLSNPIPGMACSQSERRNLPARWRELPAIHRRPQLGEEYPGRYCPPKAPKGDVYIGVGKVVKTGVVKQGRIWVDVLPIPGKSGGNYEFFDPWTGQNMPDEYWPDEECW
ncbi:uncharacterized protein BDW70DRAFT_164741 [Aspergillus foveolatus]|uniref:uncharacterized protein n=1 Tax=Aspergillus foveolatus TaxID=210207 RepID=UPI003CCE3CAC